MPSRWCWGTGPTNCSPERIRAAFFGSITGFSAPGSPRPVPEITIEPCGTALRSYGPSAARPVATVAGSCSIVRCRSDRSSASGSLAAAAGAGADSRRATGAVETESVSGSGAP